MNLYYIATTSLMHGIYVDGDNVLCRISVQDPDSIASITLGLESVKRLRDGLNQFIADAEGGGK